MNKLHLANINMNSVKLHYLQ